MDLDTLVGARLVVGFPDHKASAALIRELRALHVRHIIVFERNIVSPGQFTQLLKELEEGLGRRLTVMVDHEGGRVFHFGSLNSSIRTRHEVPQGITHFPDARTLGRTHGQKAIERQGEVEADELKRLGISVNLAPCVDVVSEGSDPVIGERSYGPDPVLVGLLGAARIKGLQSHGVAACAKHFPGLGAVPLDPHKALPTIHLYQNEMERVHLPPFLAAIRQGVRMIMSSHVCYPAMGDPEGLPATFSNRLIRDLLRRDLGFLGLILTDDLEMGALRHNVSVGEAAIRAAEAGHDLLLICSELSCARGAFCALQEAYRLGRLAREELKATNERIADLRKRFLGEKWRKDSPRSLKAGQQIG